MADIVVCPGNEHGVIAALEAAGILDATQRYDDARRIGQVVVSVMLPLSDGWIIHNARPVGVLLRISHPETYKRTTRRVMFTRGDRDIMLDLAQVRAKAEELNTLHAEYITAEAAATVVRIERLRGKLALCARTGLESNEIEADGEHWTLHFRGLTERQVEDVAYVIGRRASYE